MVPIPILSITFLTFYLKEKLMKYLFFKVMLRQKVVSRTPVLQDFTITINCKGLISFY